MAEPPPLILLVEEEPRLREVFTDILEEAGFRIELASSYADGVVLVNASKPALLIANVLLADGDGYELAQAARRLGVPALLISGHPEVILEAEARGVPFLAKPFRLPQLDRVIRTLIEGEQSATDL